MPGSPKRTKKNEYKHGEGSESNDTYVKADNKTDISKLLHKLRLKLVFKINMTIIAYS